MNVSGYAVVMIVLLGGSWANGDLFSSVHQLISLFNEERQIVFTIRTFVDQSEAIFRDFRHYLEEYESVQDDINFIMSQSLEEDKEIDIAKRLAGNPIHGYQLIKRLGLISSYFKSNNVFELISEVFKRNDLDPFSVESTLQGAAEGLIRLQNVYKLSTSSLAAGDIMGVSTLTKLSARDCLDIGRTAYGIAEYRKALDWFKEAYERAEGHPKQFFYQNEAMTYFITIGETLAMNKGQQMTYVLGENIDYRQSFNNYKALCRGEQLLNNYYAATLKCYYEDGNEPYLKMMPFKVEQHHHDPPVLVYYDIIYESEIETLKQLATNQLTRSMVVSEGGNGSHISSVRTSKQMWINMDDEHARLYHLSQRIALTTGLKVNSTKNEAEMYQVANYGIGGQYEPHLDVLWKYSKELIESLSDYEILAGERLATFMIYLDDVARGGATAFPNLGIAIQPKRGSAVFWYNLKKSGEVHNGALHGGCPVAFGSKWVSIRWIRENNNFLNRPCSLSPDE